MEDLTWQNSLRTIVTEDDVSANQLDPDTALPLAPELPQTMTEAGTIVSPDSAPCSQSSPMILHEDETDPATRTCADKTDHAQPNRQDGESDGADKDKGLKRKFSARLPSGDPLKSDQGLELLKRPRDDSDKDEDNPRETKKPSPPPDLEPVPVKALSPAPKLVRFSQMFYNLNLQNILPLGRIHGLCIIQFPFCLCERSKYILPCQ